MFPQLHKKLIKMMDGFENIRKEYHVDVFNKRMPGGLDTNILLHCATPPNASGRQYPNRHLLAIIPELVIPLYGGDIGDHHPVHKNHSYALDHKLPEGIPELYANNPTPQPMDTDKQFTYSPFGCTDEDLEIDDKLRGYFRVIRCCRLQLERQCDLCPRKGHKIDEHFWSCAWCGQIAPFCQGIQ